MRPSVLSSNSEFAALNVVLQKDPISCENEVHCWVKSFHCAFYDVRLEIVTIVPDTIC